MTQAFDKFKGWREKTLFMPNNEKISCFYFQPDSASEESSDDVNHNIFRLNANNEIIWQVRRDDSNHPADWWDTLNRIAQKHGHEGARDPFTYITLQYADGSFNDSPNEATWVPGCTIMLDDRECQQYILDPDTGIAKNVTVLNDHRQW